MYGKGHGKQTYVNGTVYEGAWYKGRRSGQGKITYPGLQQKKEEPPPGEARKSSILRPSWATDSILVVENGGRPNGAGGGPLLLL